MTKPEVQESGPIGSTLDEQEKLELGKTIDALAIPIVKYNTENAKEIGQWILIGYSAIYAVLLSQGSKLYQLLEKVDVAQLGYVYLCLVGITLIQRLAIFSNLARINVFLNNGSDFAEAAFNMSPTTRRFLKGQLQERESPLLKIEGWLTKKIIERKTIQTLYDQLYVKYLITRGSMFAQCILVMWAIFKLSSSLASSAV